MLYVESTNPSKQAGSTAQHSTNLLKALNKRLQVGHAAWCFSDERQQRNKKKRKKKKSGGTVVNG